MRTLTLALLLGLPAVYAQEHGKEAAHAESGSAGHHEDNTTMWKWANFAILAGLLGYGIAKAAGPFFRGRSAEIQKALVEARELKERADARAAEIDRRLANLAAEIETLKAEARQEMAAESERIQAETARLLAKIEQQARREIESAEKLALKELRTHAAGLAIELAGAKIRARITGPAEVRLAEQFITRLDRSTESLN
jgi:F-type H+-transporting ATPase subunit b